MFQSESKVSETCDFDLPRHVRHLCNPRQCVQCVQNDVSPNLQLHLSRPSTDAMDGR